jgi:hypothetical protein
VNQVSYASSRARAQLLTRYAFVIDGVSVVDPAQAQVSPANDNVWSLFTVPGAAFMGTLDVLFQLGEQLSSRTRLTG